jgi:hypothetical protein
MPTEQTVRDSSAQDTVAQSQPTAAYDRIEDEDEWLEEADELPRRPRRRLLSPIPLALIGVLLAACGFIAGVLIEKGQAPSSSSAGSTAASLASRFAALRGGASGATGSASSSPFAGGGGATAGNVAYISGSTLYVTTAEGNTVKITTSPGTTVTKTVKSEVKGIHPGETVTATGATGPNGAISAETIRVGAGAGGGLGALFGGSGTRAGRGAGSARTNSEPSLFGPG